MLSVNEVCGFLKTLCEQKLILGLRSSRSFCGKNFVLPGWHPEPIIFGTDFSKIGLCHTSLSVTDLQTKFEEQSNNNRAEKRVIEAIVVHEID